MTTNVETSVDSSASDSPLSAPQLNSAELNSGGQDFVGLVDAAQQGSAAADQSVADVAPAKPFEAPSEQVPLPANVCPNCLATSEKNIEYCESCGFYVRLGVVVGGPEEGQSEKPFPLGSVAAMATVFIAVAMFNIVVLFYTPPGSPERTWWSVTQLGFSVLGFLVGHIFCFLRTLDKDSSGSILDFILRPLNGWFQSVELLPKNLWAFLLAVAGITGTFGSVIVLRGIPYNALFDWEVTYEREALEGAIEDSEWEYVEPYRGEVVYVDGLEPDEAFVEDPERIYKDAVIVGYTIGDENLVDTVTVAGVVDKKLQQLGIIRTVPKGAGQKLAKELPESVRENPYVVPAETEASSDSNANAKPAAKDGPKTDEGESENVDGAAPVETTESTMQWVHPRWLCRVSYAEVEKGIKTDLQFHWIVRQLRGKSN